ncbi:MAG: hypothetical protein QM788_06320 [Roseateles sp.]|uniref:hypothetical protein n=1 Tax=Roseateles sp. TaxID=1971397 RepID=UPI0039E7B395
MAAGRLVSAAAAAAALLAAVALRTPAPAAAEPPPAQAQAAQLAWLAPPSAAARPASAAARADRPAEAASLAALLAAPPQALRATLQAALRARAEGGRLYARALARRCAALDALRSSPAAAPALDPGDPAVQQALAWRDAWAAGCGQLLAPEWLALASVPAGESGPADPLLRLLEAEATPERLAAVLARPDPLLLDEIGPALLGDDVPDAGGEDGEAGRRLRAAAWRLLPCDFGLACDASDPAVWLACLQGEGCHASRAALVLAGEAGGDPARAAAITALRERLRDAIRAGTLAMPKPVSVGRQMSLAAHGAAS